MGIVPAFGGSDLSSMTLGLIWRAACLGTWGGSSAS